MSEWDVKKETKIGEWDVKSEDAPSEKPMAQTHHLPETPPGLYRGGQLVEPLPPWLQRMSEAQKNPDWIDRQALPIIGDIAASAMPTPFGKMKAATRGGRAALKLGNLLTKGLYSAGGSGLGEAAAQKKYKEDFDPQKIFDEAKWGFAGEAGSRVVGGALMPIFKWAANITTAGAFVKEATRKTLIDKTTKRAADFIMDVAPDTVKAKGPITDIGELAMRVDEAVDEYKVAYEAYGKHIDSLKRGKEGGVLLDDTQQILGDLATTEIPIEEIIQSTYGYAPGSKQSIFLRGMMGGDVVDADNLKDFLANTYRKGKKSDWGEILPTQRKAREELKTTIKKDIAKQSPDAQKAIEQADKVFGEIANYRKIRKIFNPRTLRKMPSGDLYLNPTALSEEIYKNKKVIEDINPALWKKMESEAAFYKEMAKNWRPPAADKFSQVVGVLGRGPSVAATWAAVGPEWVPVVEGFGVFSAWMTLSPTSRKVLGSIVKNAVIKPSTHTLPLNLQSIGME